MSDADYERGVDDSFNMILKWWRSPENRADLRKLITPYIKKAVGTGKRLGALAERSKRSESLAKAVAFARKEELGKVLKECLNNETKYGKTVSYIQKRLQELDRGEQK